MQKKHLFSFLFSFHFYAVLFAQYNCYNANSQAITPIAYWSFDNSKTIGENSLNGQNKLNIIAPTPAISTNKPIVGSFLHFEPETGVIICKDISKQFAQKTDAISAEFWVRLAKKNGTLIMNFPGFRFDYDFSAFEVTPQKSNDGKVVPKSFRIDFTGINHLSTNYYNDQEWHHIAVCFSIKNNKIQVWADGQKIGEKDNIYVANTQIDLSSALFSLYKNKDVLQFFEGDLDEIAIYNAEISTTLVYKHYLEAKEKHSAYQFTDNFKASCLPAAQNLTGNYNPKDFAPENMSATTGARQQLQTFPLPRFRKNVKLLPNFFDGIQLDGLMNPNPNGNAADKTNYTSLIAENALYANLELARNWNYYLSLLNMPWGKGEKSILPMLDKNRLSGKLIQQAEENPQYPLAMHISKGVESFMKHQATSFLSPICGDKGYYICEGDVPYLSKKSYVFSPLAPEEAFRKEGISIRKDLTYLKPFLHRKIDLLVNGGEVMYGVAMPPTDKNPEGIPNEYAKDPKVLADYKNFRPTEYAKNWYTYDAEKRFQRLQCAFKDAILDFSDKDVQPIISADTKYSIYQIGADWGIYRLHYPIARKTMTPINGIYYNTENFYPYYPLYWYRHSVSSINCMGRMRKSLAITLAAGDKFYSPYIDPYPYTHNEWTNKSMDAENKAFKDGYTPAQWLGLLKYLSLTGAEFYYNFYYRQCGGQIGCRESGNNYVWMLTTPSYAQAIVSRYEDIFRNGDILAGNYPLVSDIKNSEYQFTFYAGNNNILVGVRKKGNRYAICGNVNPLSNKVGNAPLTDVATIQLEGQELTFEVRRQGSCYVYDKSTNPPVFYQLDAWHEVSHPYYWSPNFVFEGELYDNPEGTFDIKTEGLLINGNKIDARNSTGYLVFSSQNLTKEVEFNFEPRIEGKNSYNLNIRARSSQANGKIEVFLDGQKLGSLSISASQWQNVKFPSKLSAVALGKSHKLSLKATNASIEIDKVSLEVE